MCRAVQPKDPYHPARARHRRPDNGRPEYTPTPGVEATIPAEFYGLIVAGGSGTRLWPISRSTTPKQLLALSGSGHSLLQDAFLRLARHMPASRIRTVAGSVHAQQALAQLQVLAPDYPRTNVMVEPLGRDSAAAVLWGTLRLHQEAPDAVMAVMWADLCVRDEAAYDGALRRGYDAVKDGGLVAIGVRPTRPDTRLGYICYGQEVQEGVYEVKRFVEKPNPKVAQQLIDEGNCVWNAGIFVFKVSTLLSEFERLAPDLTGHFGAHMPAAGSCAWTDPQVIKRVYDRLPKSSLDHVILERTDQLRIIPADLDWSDLGVWNEIYALQPKDADGNATSGNVVKLDTQNTYVRGGRRLITTVGVQDLIIVDTDDALLVAHMSKVEDVNRLVAQLDSVWPDLIRNSSRSERPWGSFALLTEGPGFKVKVLEVNPHQRLSLQKHQQREEHWVILEGQARLTCESLERICGPGEYFHIPAGAIHRIENQSDERVRVFELQRGSYLGDDDIVRLEDDYGRAKT